MLILLAMPVLVAVAAVHRYLQYYAPSNLLIRRVRARQAGWRTVVSLLAISAALLLAMHGVALAVASGAPSWLNLVVLVLAWDAIKLILVALVVAARSLCRLVAACRPVARFTASRLILVGGRHREARIAGAAQRT